MKEKCNKYEAFFVFTNEKEFQIHLLECGDCQKEHQKAQKISALVKEAAPYYKNLKRRNSALKKVCASFLLVLTLFGAGIFYNNHNANQYLAQAYLEEYGSAISDMGFPVDEYGLLLAD